MHTGWLRESASRKLIQCILLSVGFRWKLWSAWIVATWGPLLRINCLSCTKHSPILRSDDTVSCMKTIQIGHSEKITGFSRWYLFEYISKYIRTPLNCLSCTKHLPILLSDYTVSCRITIQICDSEKLTGFSQCNFFECISKNIRAPLKYWVDSCDLCEKSLRFRVTLHAAHTLMAYFI